MLIPPPGILRPNRAAIEAGLSFAQAFQNGPAAPFLTRGGLAAGTMALAGSGTINVLHGGHGVTGNGGYWGAGTSADNTYALPVTEGTVLVAVVADHAANDSTPHQPFFFGANSTNRAVEAVKWSDNNLYIGILDKRMSFSVVGLYSAGDVFTMATTWNAAGQATYLKGTQRATTASTGLGDTSGAYFVAGQDWAATRKWSSGTTGGILYVLIFDRALSAQEMLAAEADLWWWCRQEPVRTMRRSAVVLVSVSLTGVAATTSAGSVAYGLGIDAAGSGATGSAGTVGPTIGLSASGSAATASAGTATSAIGLAVTGEAMTVSAGSLAYTIGFILTGAASAASSGTLAADNGAVTRSLTGIQMSAVPGNVRVTGGTRWVPQEARAVTLPTAVGNTLPPPPRLTGDAQADIRAQGQWLATLYDQMVKVNNVFGRINDHETRIAALEASNDNGN